MIRVLALHGFTGAPESFDAVVHMLDEGITLIAPMLSGHGTQPTTVDSFEAEVERLGTLLPGDDSVVLLGYSLGGRLALGLLARYPARFRGAVLVSANPGLTEEAERIARAQSDDALAKSLREGGLERFLETWESGPLFAAQAHLPASVRDARRATRRRHQAAPLAAALSALSLGRMPDFRAMIARRPVPMTFVAGESDSKFAELAIECASLAGTSPVVVPGVGHDVLLERPDLIAGLMERMLR